MLEEERIVDGDVAFPLRQLADVALKGLSPGINDPTTAENAMDSVADTLVRFARAPKPSLLRVDERGEPRLHARTPSFDALVELGFDQVRRSGADKASFAVRLLELLAELRDVAAACDVSFREIDRQARAIRDDAVGRATVEVDERLVADAFDRLHAARERVSA